jgi:3-oxoacyl-[acyl-carrier protein] reductase
VDLGIEGRVALVLGASRGIGRGIALELAAAGADVIVNYRRDQEAANEVVAEAGGRALAIQASMSDPADVDRLADEALAAFGVVDILVANAGIASRGHSIADTDPAEVVRVMTTHTFSTHRLAQRLLPGMRSRERSDVVVISSSELNRMKADGAPYNMAKAAQESLAFTLAREEAEHGIRVNVVVPGLTNTDLGQKVAKGSGVDDIHELNHRFPLGRVTEPEDIAQAVRFLVSTGGEHITGQRLVIDGGGFS